MATVGENSIGGVWPFVRSEHFAVEVDSTNDWAKRLVFAGEVGDLPALVWADRQTRGRGQGVNTWWSDGGSLTASVIIDPDAMDLPIGLRPRVALATASAMVRAIGAINPGCSAGIRWPNDVEADGRKLGGVLVEMVQGPMGGRLVVGMGLNVQARLDLAPESVRRMAASVVDPIRDEVTGDLRGSSLRAILSSLGPSLDSLIRGDADLVADWNRLDTLKGATIRVESAGETFEAIADGIAADGSIRLIRGGRPTFLHAGRILRDSPGTHPYRPAEA